MTAPLIAPLIPPRTRPDGRKHGGPGTARRLPMATAPEVPAVPDDVAYGTGRIDESGRVADRAMTSALGWQPGDRLTLTAAAGVVFARRDPGGLVTMPARPYLVIPAALRRRCGLRPGDRVLPTPSEMRQLMAYVKTHVVARRNARGGRSAQEHLVAALRCLYQRTVEDELIAAADNPARKVAKPRRRPSTRRAVPDTRLAEIKRGGRGHGR